LKGKYFYKVLGFEREVNEKELKKAYRKPAMKYHPNKNQNNVEETEAYDILSDQKKRKIYEQF
jgi:DnaJ-class molecular chaperone